MAERQHVVPLMEGPDRIIPCTHLHEHDGLTVKAHSVSIDDTPDSGARVLFDLIWNGPPDRAERLVVHTIIQEYTEEYRQLVEKPDQDAIIAAAAAKLSRQFQRIADSLRST